MLISGALGGFVLVHGCTQPNNSQSDDRSELGRFMELSQDIDELFEQEIYASDTFVLDSGDLAFRVARIDSREVSSYRIFPRNGVITTSFGQAPVATVGRDDDFFGSFTQRNGPTGRQIDTIYDARLSREVLFLKLGSDADPFLGWELIGIDLGKPLGSISEFVTIRKIPARLGFPTVLSNQSQETGLPIDFRNFTFIFDIKSVDAGDSIDIQTKRGPMTIFANTNVGFRQLSGKRTSSGSTNNFAYGFRTPPADPQNKFYHLITFQIGPEEAIDSTDYNVFVAFIKKTPIIPPDTTIVFVLVPDTLFDTTFILYDTCADSLILDTFYLDVCIEKELFSVDTLLTGSTVVPDTTIVDTLFETIYDSVLLPPDTLLVLEDLWVFPYSVR